MSVEVRITDNSKQTLEELNKAVAAALEGMGNQCVSYAMNNIEAAGRTDTHTMHNSINHKVNMGSETVHVGTNVEYAPYHEYGTGKFAGGSGGYWVYVAGGGGGGGSGKRYTFEKAKQVVAILRQKGLDAHMTDGLKPIHFLKNAVADHIDVYKAIITKYLKAVK